MLRLWSATAYHQRAQFRTQKAQQNEQTEIKIKIKSNSEKMCDKENQFHSVKIALLGNDETIEIAFNSILH